MSYTVDGDLPMHHDGLTVAAPGMYASLSYESPRETRIFEQGRGGTVTAANFDADGLGSLTFYDEFRDRRFRVTSGETFEDTRVESLPPEGEDGNTQTVGRVLRFTVHKDEQSSRFDSLNVHARKQRADYPFLVAGIRWNRHYLDDRDPSTVGTSGVKA